MAQRPPASRVLRVAHRKAQLRELHVLRATLAAEAAAQAAMRRRSAGQRLELFLQLEGRQRAMLEGSPTEFTRADLDLHNLVAGVAGNPLHAAIERVTGNALRTDLAGRARRLAFDPGLDDLHRSLLEAIDASDADAARTAAQAIATAEGMAPD